MKKSSLITALLVALSLAFVPACKGKKKSMDQQPAGDTTGAAKPADMPPAGDTAAAPGGAAAGTADQGAAAGSAGGAAAGGATGDTAAAGAGGATEVKKDEDGKKDEPGGAKKKAEGGW